MFGSNSPKYDSNNDNNRHSGYRDGYGGNRHRVALFVIQATYRSVWWQLSQFPLFHIVANIAKYVLFGTVRENLL